MAIKYRSIGGGRRAWSVDTWAEWQSLPVAKMQDGDTLWYGDGRVSLTRRNSRWRPDEEHLWGRNDAAVGAVGPSHGSVDSEGVWTAPPNPTGYLPPSNAWFDCLAIVMPDRSAFGWSPYPVTGAPSFVGVRCVVMTTASSTLAVTATQNDSIYGGAAISYGADGTDVIYYGQGIVLPGGYGGDGDSSEGGESLWRPALTDYSVDVPYDEEASGQAPITIWGGWEQELRNPIGGGS